MLRQESDDRRQDRDRWPRWAITAQQLSSNGCFREMVD
jgi:hypothetical protein